MRKLRVVKMATFTILTLTTLFIAGCTAKNTSVQNQQTVPEKDAKLIIWNNGGLEAKWAEYVAQQFTKKYQIPVEVEEMSNADMMNKMVKEPGDSADLFDISQQYLSVMSESKLIQKNNLDSRYQNQYLKQAIDASSYMETKSNKQSLYGFPVSVETYALYYNKKMVEIPAQTWDELINQASQINDVKRNIFGFMLQPSNYYYIHAIAAGYGGYEFGSKGVNVKDIGLNNQGAVKAGLLIQKIHNEILPIPSEKITDDFITNSFINNRLAYIIQSSSNINMFKKTDIDFGVVTLPKLENGKIPTSFAEVRSYYISSNTKYPKAASLYAQFATGKSMELKLYQMTGEIPANKEVLNSNSIKEDATIYGFVKQIQNSQPVPETPEMVNIWMPMNTAYAKIWNKNVDVQRTLDDAVKQIEEDITTKSK